MRLADDPRLHACGLAYMSDVCTIDAISKSYPDAPQGEAWSEVMMGASLDHAMWFHQPARADEWVMMELTGHGMIGTRGLATGPVFDAGGTHVATIAQEGLLRRRR